jgi:hypothetical protein
LIRLDILKQQKPPRPWPVAVFAFRGISPS